VVHQFSNRAQHSSRKTIGDVGSETDLDIDGKEESEDIIDDSSSYRA